MNSSNIQPVEASTRGVLWKKVFLEISQNSQVFSCEFCKISRNTFSQNTSRWLLLNLLFFTNISHYILKYV